MTGKYLHFFLNIFKFKTAKSFSFFFHLFDGQDPRLSREVWNLDSPGRGHKLGPFRWDGNLDCLIGSIHRIVRPELIETLNLPDRTRTWVCSNSAVIKFDLKGLGPHTTGTRLGLMFVWTRLKPTFTLTGSGPQTTRMGLGPKTSLMGRDLDLPKCGLDRYPELSGRS